jgi:hypothetical protein
LGMVTGKFAGRPHGRPNIKKAAEELSLYALLVIHAGIRIGLLKMVERRIARLSPLFCKELINAVKRLAVSTG